MAAQSTLSQASFGLATALTGYLSYRIMSPPQIRQKDSTGAVLDKVVGTNFFLGAILYRLFLVSVAICQGLVSYNRNLAPSTPDPRYPMNELLLTWNPVSAATLAFIWVGGLTRLRSFHELGKNFTFDLHEPDELNTRGLYKYVQHPSYTGILALIVGTYWFFRCDGVLATVLPESVLRHRTWLNVLIPSIPSISTAFMMMVRVRDEEAMLKKKFGKEWEEWNARTPRFFPFWI